MSSRSRNEKKGDYRLLVLLVLGLLIGVLHLARPKQAFLPNSLESKAHFDDATYIWLAGQNIYDGVYSLPRPTSVQEISSFAGVPLDAGPEASELVLEPFSSLYLEPAGQVSIKGRHPRLAPFFFQPIPINEADVKTLTTIAGIGPVLARRIVALREQKGAFHKPEELLAVRGIGHKKLARIRKEVRFK